MVFSLNQIWSAQAAWAPAMMPAEVITDGPFSAVLATAAGSEATARRSMESARRQGD
jgi:hypothetical protein